MLTSSLIGRDRLVKDADRLRLREKPKQPPLMYQTWSNLAFFHWRLDPNEVQRRLPKGLYVDCYEDSAWLGVVPFYMRNIRFRGTPSLPWVSNFLELNVRTYVHDEFGVPGVWFFSLDCNQPLAVWTARSLFHLNYQHAYMKSVEEAKCRFQYESRRKGSGGSPSVGKDNRSIFDYELRSEIRFAEVGSLEFFLAERYILFCADRKVQLWRGRVHHSPYPLVDVTARSVTTDLIQRNSLTTLRTEFDHVIGSHGVDVSVYPLERVK